MNAPQKIQRVHATLTSGAERTLLIWMAERLPRWVTPDQLTALGMISALVIAAGYLGARQSYAFLWLANAGWLIHWFGDSLDGTLARVRHIERPKYGHYVDHYVDTVATIIIGLGVAYSGLTHPTTIFLLLLSYLFLSVHAYLWGAVRGEFRISYGYVGPTEARIVYVLLNFWVLIAGNEPVTALGNIQLTLLDVAALLLSAFFIVITVRHGLRSIAELKRLGV